MDPTVVVLESGPLWIPFEKQAATHLDSSILESLFYVEIEQAFCSRWEPAASIELI